jgi:hypothetical protein
MTTLRPSGRIRILTAAHHLGPRNAISPCILQIRRYASKPPAPKYTVPSAAATAPSSDPIKSALTLVESNAPHDPVNPPLSTLPPPLSLPTRGSENVFTYLFRLGRAYGGFYKNGIKAVWFNYKASSALHQRLKEKHSISNSRDAVVRDLLSRSEFQLLARNRHDIGKLPFFGLLVLLLGEWLPLVVPFMPGVVPGTCRIPKQIKGMREKAEERRRMSFRSAVLIPSDEQLMPGEGAKGDAWPVAFNLEHRTQLLKKLRDDQLHHLSSTLGLHSRLWDRIQLAPPSFLLRRVISKHLEYLASDDFLLLRYPSATKALSPEELDAACEERGLDVLGRREDVLRHQLTWWLTRQQEDAGRGAAMMAMLFRRLAMREWVQLHVRANHDR